MATHTVDHCLLSQTASSLPQALDECASLGCARLPRPGCCHFQGPAPRLVLRQLPTCWRGRSCAVASLPMQCNAMQPLPPKLRCGHPLRVEDCSRDKGSASIAQSELHHSRSAGHLRHRIAVRCTVHAVYIAGPRHAMHQRQRGYDLAVMVGPGRAPGNVMKEAEEADAVRWL